nr:hypothetical protein [Tanacetum cinerariifolium]
MEASGKDRPPMLAPGNYVQWKSRIKRYIDTKPNHELIHYCLKNPPYNFTWADKEVPVSKGSSVTTTETYMENYKNVSQDIRNQLNTKAKVVQIILTGIDNDIYFIVDACPNACEMWKSIERFVTLVKQSQELKTVSYHKLYDILKQHQNEVNEIRAERIALTANPLALVSQQQPVHHPQNHPTHYTQNSSTRSQQAATRNRGKAIVNSPPPFYDHEPSMVAEDEEFGHVARECQKPKRAKDAAYHREKMLLCKHEEAGIQLNAEQADWRDDTDDESEDQELEAHYIEQIDQNDDDDDLANEQTSNKGLVEQLQGEIEDFKTQNKSLESSNNRFKEANNKLSETNKLMYIDLKKFKAELDRRNDMEYVSKMEIDCAKLKEI